MTRQIDKECNAGLARPGFECVRAHWPRNGATYLVRSDIGQLCRTRVRVGLWQRVRTWLATRRDRLGNDPSESVFGWNCSVRVPFRIGIDCPSLNVESVETGDNS
jgi:hypothetical protein